MSLSHKTATAQKYDFNNPSQTWDLPDELIEVSGLQYTENNSIMMVHDEGGVIYDFDLSSGTIKSKETFRDKGDFEGVAKYKDTIYSVRSNGNISIIEGFPDSIKDKTVKTPLKSENNVEGLVFDPSTNLLLLACKEDAGIEKKISKTKAIYAYSIDKETFFEDPYLLISDKEIEDFRGKQSFSFMQRMLNWFNEEFYSFKPSGIAIHPISGHLYILAHKGLKIIVHDRNEIVDILDLPSVRFPQAEGITFAPDGTLFISNEGDLNNATLLSFTPR